MSKLHITLALSVLIYSIAQTCSSHTVCAQDFFSLKMTAPKDFQKGNVAHFKVNCYSNDDYESTDTDYYFKIPAADIIEGKTVCTIAKVFSSEHKIHFRSDKNTCSLPVKLDYNYIRQATSRHNSLRNISPDKCFKVSKMRNHIADLNRPHDHAVICFKSNKSSLITDPIQDNMKTFIVFPEAPLHAPLHHIWTYPFKWAILPPKEKWKLPIYRPDNTSNRHKATSISDVLSDIAELLSLKDKTYVFLLGHGDKGNKASEEANTIISRGRVLGWKLLLEEQFAPQIKRDRLIICGYWHGTLLNIPLFNSEECSKEDKLRQGLSVYPKPTNYNRRVDILITSHPNPAILRELRRDTLIRRIKKVRNWKNAGEQLGKGQNSYNVQHFKALREALQQPPEQQGCCP